MRGLAMVMAWLPAVVMFDDPTGWTLWFVALALVTVKVIG
jgi:hypothetical protein